MCLCRWVRAEKIPLHTPLEGMGSSNVGHQNVFFTTVRDTHSEVICMTYLSLLQARLVTTAVLIENTFRLYLNLPLPPVPSPNPHQISHILIDRLKLTGPPTPTHSLCVCVSYTVFLLLLCRVFQESGGWGSECGVPASGVH